MLILSPQLFQDYIVYILAVTVQEYGIRRYLRDYGARVKCCSWVQASTIRVDLIVQIFKIIYAHRKDTFSI